VSCGFLSCSVTSFPFVALYLPETGRKIQRVFAHEGDVSGAELLRLVTAAVLPAIERRDALQAEEIARRVGGVSFACRG
jgi:hypothetical protein